MYVLTFGAGLAVWEESSGKNTLELSTIDNDSIHVAASRHARLEADAIHRVIRLGRHWIFGGVVLS